MSVGSARASDCVTTHLRAQSRPPVRWSRAATLMGPAPRSDWAGRRLHVCRRDKGQSPPCPRTTQSHAPDGEGLWRRRAEPARLELDGKVGVARERVVEERGHESLRATGVCPDNCVLAFVSQRLRRGREKRDGPASEWGRGEARSECARSRRSSHACGSSGYRCTASQSSWRSGAGERGGAGLRDESDGDDDSGRASGGRAAGRGRGRGTRVRGVRASIASSRSELQRGRGAVAVEGSRAIQLEYS